VKVHDAIVIGAGHNGLTAAATLARAGHDVVVLERTARIGGLAAAQEFSPGFRTSGLLHDTRGLRPAVRRALQLRRHGLELERGSALLALADDGSSLRLSGDPGVDARAVEARHADDARRYLELADWIEQVRPVVDRHLDSAPLDLLELESNPLRELLHRALDLRRLGGSRMLDLARVPPMSVADWLDEWFRDPLLKSTLAHGALMGGFHGPHSPGTAANLLLQLAGAGPAVRGGGAALVGALESAARAAGATLRTEAPVTAIRVAGGAACGVALADGEELAARVVACACDPKHALLELLPRGLTSSRLERQMRLLRSRGTTARLLLALEGKVRFGGRDGAEAPRARTGDRIEALERAFDPVKYGDLPERPLLDVLVPTVESPELAPPGHSVVSVLIHFVPHTPRDGGWSDAARRSLRDAAVQRLSAHVGDLEPRIHAELLSTPADLEREFGLPGGQIHHGEHALDQLLVRPAPECARYATPIEGLFLCGGGSHPGGGISCAPGALGARAILAGRAAPH
jgi:phytoene dehydrogenase-like protein